MIRRILIVGGANGVGLAIAQELAERKTTEKVYVVDKVPLMDCYAHEKIEAFQFDLTNLNYSFFDRFSDINALMITAGFGKLSLFKDISEQHIIDSFNVNTIPVIRLIKRFYSRIENCEDFYCGVMDSIAGWMSSPFFAVYGATKAALKIFIESVNVELIKAGSCNVILNVSPGTINGTNFYGGLNNLEALHNLSQEIILHIEAKDEVFIPQYEEVFKEVLNRYHKDFRKEGLHSYEYKMNSKR
ncbi:MAG: SDR family oxidoreductase [Bacteroidaceae bacterium]|nr:SDR family oxidoreductase [Bacteroidaceae bacterium]